MNLCSCVVDVGEVLLAEEGDTCSCGHDLAAEHSDADGQCLVDLDPWTEED